MQRVSRKLHLWGQEMAVMDDPLGDYFLRLEERVRQLEGEVQQLRKPPSGDAADTGTVPSIVSLHQHKHNDDP